MRSTGSLLPAQVPALSFRPDTQLAPVENSRDRASFCWAAFVVMGDGLAWPDPVNLAGAISSNEKKS